MRPERPLILYYHGSVNRQRLPTQVVSALIRLEGAIRLRVVGYEVPGSFGYASELIELASEHGDLVDFVGTISPHDALLRYAADAHVGLSLTPKAPNDINMQYMVGASNKSFDYMASGLPLLVTEAEDWVTTFVKPGFGRACDPDNVESIAAELMWYWKHPEERQLMARRCVEQVVYEWNYDQQFAAVAATLETGY
jgi:glycosyltransferase involved in cell wall biosynthesis